jgi:hypothetical protein
MATSKLVWKKHPEGGYYANYKLGTITKFNDIKSTYYNVKLGYNDVRMASNLIDAKKKIDLYTKNKMATTKKAVKRKPAATKKTSKSVKQELKEAGYRLPHGYDVVKRTPKKKKAATKKKVTPKKRVAKKVVAKKKVTKKAAPKKKYKYLPMKVLLP